MPDFKPIAYVGLTSTSSITGDLLCRTVSDWMAERRRDLPVKLLANESSLSLGGSILMVGSCPMLTIPIDSPLMPGLVVDDSAQNHVFPGWRDALARHRAHLIVMPLLRPNHDFEDEPARDVPPHLAARNTFDVASALASLTDAVGAYWLPSKLFHDRRDFAERRSCRRKSSAELLIRLRWFGDSAADGQDRGPAEIGACTTGLSVFAGRELVHPPSSEEPSLIYGRVLDVCSQLIERGAPAVDGECLGGSTSDRVRLMFAASRRGEPIARMEVERLEFA